MRSSEDFEVGEVPGDRLDSPKLQRILDISRSEANHEKLEDCRDVTSSTSTSSIFNLYYLLA